jgi:hypothetical protein
MCNIKYERQTPKAIALKNLLSFINQRQGTEIPLIIELPHNSNSTPSYKPKSLGRKRQKLTQFEENEV